MREEGRKNEKIEYILGKKGRSDGGGGTGSRRMKRRIDSGRRNDSLQRRNNDDSLNPRIRHHFFGADSSLGIRIEHALDDRSTFPWDEVGERRRRGGSGVHLKVGTKGGIGRLRDSPRELLEMHTVEDDCASPYVD